MNTEKQAKGDHASERAEKHLNAAIAEALSKGDAPIAIDIGCLPRTNDPTGSLLFLGDVALARNVGAAIEKHGGGFLFQRCPRDFLVGDAVCINLECCLSERGALAEPKPVPLVGRPSYLYALPFADRCVANLANNHFLDFGADAAMDTIAALDEAGIRYIGARGTAAVPQPLLITTLGGTVGLLAFAPCAHVLSNEPRINVETGCAGAILAAVTSLQRRVDVVIVSLHQGVEYCPLPLPADRMMCRRILQSGAALVICHHPHVVQGIESFGHGVVFHSLGNFAIDVPEDRRPAAARTIAVRVRLADQQIFRLEIEPFEITDALQPVPLVGQARDDLVAHLHKLSTALQDPKSARRAARAALRARRCARIAAARDMLRRVGVCKTARYYVNRVARM